MNIKLLTVVIFLISFANLNAMAPWYFQTSKEIQFINASMEGNLEEIKTLLQQSIDINANNYIGTALYYAAKNGHYEIVKLLIEAKADLNCQSNTYYKQTPLLAAIYNNHTEIASLLIQKGANINWFEKKGKTPLMEACTQENIPIIKELLQKGADINAREQFGLKVFSFIHRGPYWSLITDLLQDELKKRELGKEMLIRLNQLNNPRLITYVQKNSDSFSCSILAIVQRK